jgi:CubicO group peptidase (beta-lactamase class C family)
VSASKKPRPKPKPVTPPVIPPPAVPADGPIGYQTVLPGAEAKPATPMVAASALPPRTAATPISAEDIETFTDSVVRTLMQRDHVLGVTVAVVQGNTPLLLKGYGYDRLSPVRRVDPNNSLFRIGSVTKTFTWIVGRQELEAGRVKMDASIGSYLPADVYSEDRRFKPITLRELMDHTSGYEDTSLGHLFQLNGSHLTGADSYFRVHRPKRVREPGEFASYSNFGAALAARALQQTARAKDVPTLMETRVFQPLGMNHTSLREPYSPQALNLENLPDPLSAELTQDLSDGFVWDGATYEAQPFEHAIPLSGALGASSTAQDMARLMAMMLGNGQIDGIQLFNADSAKAFRQPLLKMPEGYNGWASGLMVREAPAGFTTYGHGGATLWFNANMVIVPEMNLGIFIGANTQTGAALAASYPNLLLDHLNGDTVKPPLMPSPANAYAQHRDYYRAIEGQYVSTRRA